MKIKKGDKVQVITGKDKGKSGAVVKSYPKLDMVLVENLNLKKRHVRPKKEGQKGQVVDTAAPIHVSNVKKLEK